MKENRFSGPSCTRLRIQAMTFSGSRDFFHVYLEAPDWDFKPGQFVMIRPDQWDKDPVWPRPFSICEKTEDGLRLFIQVVGKGTRLISKLGPGSLVDLWGPLGNGFVFDQSRDIFILAGGMGIAPFVGLCKRHQRPEKVSLLFGHRVNIGCFPFDELPEEINKEHMIQQSSEDLAVFQDVLQQRIKAFSGKGRILACGPVPFLEFVRDCSLKYGADTWISLETRMACGVGACLGCVTKTAAGEYVQTCTSGPVFKADQAVLDGRPGKRREKEWI